MFSSSSSGFLPTAGTLSSRQLRAAVLPAVAIATAIQPDPCAFPTADHVYALGGQQQAGLRARARLGAASERRPGRPGRDGGETRHLRPVQMPGLMQPSAASCLQPAQVSSPYGAQTPRSEPGTASVSRSVCAKPHVESEAATTSNSWSSRAPSV